eukprot:TRINITY_DN4625_c0_g1_i1.p1 TRINITY_DN4625_c0_g1~~TRINITY_DN4625_c0_g1_i1.p1  ORF type:complete len:231 (+),score=15.85 TRINITY_DN4625_c0_g1_i1:92-784(+)
MRLLVSVVILCVYLACVPRATDAQIGVDVSSPLDATALECLQDEGGISRVAARAWISTGEFDPTSVQTISAGANLSMQFDVYMFPCTGKAPDQQVIDMVTYLRGNNSHFDTIWFDIESNPETKCDWRKDQSWNCLFLQEMMSAAESLYTYYGLYASKREWAIIFGDSCNFTSGTKVPLWYPSYNIIPNFSDFTPFGGFSFPTAKQYAGDVFLCGHNVDLNYIPDDTMLAR